MLFNSYCLSIAVVDGRRHSAVDAAEAPIRGGTTESVHYYGSARVRQIDSDPVAVVVDAVADEEETVPPPSSSSSSPSSRRKGYDGGDDVSSANASNG